MRTIKPSVHRVKLLSEIVSTIKSHPNAKPTEEYVGDILIALDLTAKKNNYRGLVK